MRPAIAQLHAYSRFLQTLDGESLQDERLHDYRVMLRRVAAITPVLFDAEPGAVMARWIRKELAHSNPFRDRDVVRAYMALHLPQEANLLLAPYCGYQPSSARLSRLRQMLLQWQPLTLLELNPRFYLQWNRSLRQMEKRMHGFAEANTSAQRVAMAHKLRVAIKSARYLHLWWAIFHNQDEQECSSWRVLQDLLGQGSDLAMFSCYLRHLGCAGEARRVEIALARWQEQLPDVITPLCTASYCRMQALSAAMLSGYFFH